MSLKDLIGCKRVALIGPADYLDKIDDTSKKENLNNIERADTIVRLNCTFNIRDKYSHLLGTRTDIMYNSLLDNCNNGGVLNVDEILSAGVKHIRTTPQSSTSGIATSNQRGFSGEIGKKILELKNRNIDMSVMDFNLFNRLSSEIKCRPTTGFASIFDILSYRPAELYITGFSFFLGPPLKDYWGGKNKGGIEEVFGRTEAEEAERGFNSTRHIHKNMWKLLKDNIEHIKNLRVDNFMSNIIRMENFSRVNYEKLF